MKILRRKSGNSLFSGLKNLPNPKGFPIISHSLDKKINIKNI